MRALDFALGTPAIRCAMGTRQTLRVAEIGRRELHPAARVCQVQAVLDTLGPAVPQRRKRH